MTRKRINPNDEAEVLASPRRRCAICFGLNKDFTRKNGQIAHIDRNRSNSKIDNLIFLCLEHHNEYDSKTSQSKGITKKELLIYKSQLMSHIVQWEKDKQINHETNTEAEQGDQNKFTVFKMVNQDSIYGFPFIAINDTQKRCISFTEDFVAIEDVSWETRQWLNCDYKRCKETFSFDLSGLNDFISRSFSETDYFVSASYNAQDAPKSILLTFNADNKYYEMEFNLDKNGLVKKTNNGHQIFLQVINANSLDEDFVVFQSLTEKLKPLFAQNALLHS